MFDPLSIQEKSKLHDWNTLPKPKSDECDLRYEKFRRTRKPPPKGPGPVTWTVSDIAKAGCLLSCPPVTVNFEDEQEMRRVYSLIYDVFRYKNVLTQALLDINFFATFPKLSANEAVVWLLFYDLYHRSFNKREPTITPLATQLFNTFGLSFPENALWSKKVKLAAAVARLRIKNNALSLSEMLPPHLKDEKVTAHAQTNPVTCWVNYRKAKNVQSLCQDIERYFGLRLVTDNILNPHTFKWDRHCPQTIVFHASMRPRLAKSRFVKEHEIVVQDKSFCMGPATFKKLITDLQLTGSVIQTHVNSPRTTAYLATLLSQNEKVTNLLAFSAGKRKQEYEHYFNELGMSNVKLFSDRLIDLAPDANYMEEVVAVFATPPNSYSAVVDPIDLVCSRGGDLSMLEILTETGDSKEARKRIASILEEQQKTLRYAMSRPQIQFVLYETHSELDAENTCMVNMTLKDINKIAKMHHATLQGKLMAPHPSENTLFEDKEVNNNEENIEDSVIKTPSRIVLLSETTDEEETFLDTIKVPKTDLFHNVALPLHCNNENCKKFACPGCFLAVLQRKEIIRLDDKYMIQMAEQRGLFGTQASGVKSKTVKSVRKKIEKEQKSENAPKRFSESEDEDDAMYDEEEERIFECSTQTRDKFIMQPLKIYQLSESETRLILTKPGPVFAKPITNNAREKFSQSPSLHRFSLARLQREDNEPIPECEQFKSGKHKKDVSILAQPPTRTILSKLSSAHIRQFVCPFYKQLDFPHIRGPPLTEIFKADLQDRSEQFNDILTNSQIGCAQTEQKFLKKKIDFPQVDSPVVQYQMPKMPKPPKRPKKIERIIARLTAPTHSSRVRHTPKKKPLKISPNRLIEMVEKPQKIPECKHCHMKNLKIEKNDPNYDELQEFLDNIEPLKNEKLTSLK